MSIGLGHLKKGQVKSTKNKRACIKRLMLVEEAEEVCHERNSVGSWSLPTPIGDGRDGMNVLCVVRQGPARQPRGRARGRRCWRRCRWRRRALQTRRRQD